MPEISVAIPVYNCEGYIVETIRSLINQTYQDFEIILVDDASTDNSYRVIHEMTDPRIKLHRNEQNMGIAYTRNKAISLSNGEFIAFLDDDDIAMPYRFEHQITYLKSHPDVDLVGGHLRRIDVNGKDLNSQWNVYLNPDYIKAYLMLGNTIASGTVMIRKKFILINNLRFRDNQYGAEDYRFWVECSLLGKISNLDEVLQLWRVGHNAETTRVFKNKFEERKKIIDEIHKLALEGNGIHLLERELEVVNKVFMEEGIVESEAELQELYQVLKKISAQAELLQLSNRREIKTMCRKRFGEKVGQAYYLWA